MPSAVPCKTGNATLASLRDGASAKVTAIAGGEFMRKRLSAMGIYEGRQIRKISSAPGGAAVVEAAGCQVALGRRICEHVSVEPRPFPVLLTGNPNVGKSVVFSRLTGIGAISSNYPGTTVEYLHGSARLGGEQCRITDVPGAYSLEASCKAEEVACRMLEGAEDSVFIHVVDSTSLERNLFFALEILSLKRPVIILLNKWDIARMRGITIDADALSKMLGAPCVPFVAVSGEGLPELEKQAASAMRGELAPPSAVPPSSDEKWKLIGEISRRAQHIAHRHPSALEKMASLSILPATGIPIALLVLAASFYFVRLVGEGLVDYVLGPAYYHLYLPLLQLLEPSHYNMAVKLLFGAPGEPLSGFGVLTSGVYVAFVPVLAYVLAFYAALGFLEDTGYIPRLAVLLDAVLHKIGLHGYASVPVLLGLGCKVPGILATRVLETRREKIIALSLTLLAAPCMPQSAMIISLLAPRGFGYVLAVFGTLLLTGALAGYALNKIMKGAEPELFVEIPAWQWPNPRVYGSKLWLRFKNYIVEAAPMIMAGIAVIALAQWSGLADRLASVFKGPVSLCLGLPPDTASPILLGFLRKDVSIALLVPFELSSWQIVTASVFLAGYMPCAASLAALSNEVGVKDTFKIAALNFAAAFAVASLLHFISLLWRLHA
ncbi:MAG: fused ferrous iron transport protein A/B [Elusimicrobiales bacterium]